MPLVDMPLSELYAYEGRNPRPWDFDAYWDAGLLALQNTDPAPELKAAEFSLPGIECFHLYFTGVKGARIHAKYLRPKGKAGCPAVLEFHGYTGQSGDWQGKAAYALAGLCIASMDCRGQAGLSQDVGGVMGTTVHGHIIRGLSDPDPNNLLMRDIFLDTAQLARVVCALSEVDESRVGAMGMSQGGGLTLACAALAPQVKFAAPGYPFLCDYKRVWEMDLAKDAYEEIRTYFRNHDPLHEREGELFEKLGYIDVQHLAPRIRGRILMATGLMDTICPPSSQFAAYNKITSPKEVVIYPDFGHEGLPGWQDRVMGEMVGLGCRQI